jgi:hypothetical protein
MDEAGLARALAECAFVHLNVGQSGFFQSGCQVREGFEREHGASWTDQLGENCRVPAHMGTDINRRGAGRNKPAITALENPLVVGDDAVSTMELREQVGMDDELVFASSQPTQHLTPSEGPHV